MPSLLLCLLSALLCSPASALEPPKGPDDGPVQQLAPTFTRLHLPLDDDTLAALKARDHATAAQKLAAMDRSKLSGEAVGDHAFVLAWSLIRAGQADKTEGLYELVERAEHVPAAYKALTMAELLVVDGRHAEAATLLGDIPEDALLYPRVQLVRAQALREAGATKDARAIYETLVARPDPAEGSDLALLALASLEGKGSPEAYAHLRRLWSIYPYSEAGQEAAAQLQGYKQAATWRDLSWRGDRLMSAGNYQGAITLLASKLGEIKEPDADACRYWYAYGRSLFRVNRLTEAAAVLTPAGERCKGHDDDRGPKSLYLAGKAQERKKAWADAAKVYKRISELYPEHSYADDGLALAGIATQEAGDLDGAIALWAEQATRYPTGDLAGEGFFRLAWGAYLAGDTPEAIKWAEKAIWDVPLNVDAEHVRAAMYWSARWRAYPDVSAPTQLTKDTKAKDEAVRLWLRLCTEHPWSYYALLAAGRLQELAPDQLAKVPRPERPEHKPWMVREAFLQDPAISAGIALARLGLYREALTELNHPGADALTPAEYAFIISIMWQFDDWLIAHDRLRNYLEEHPTEQLGAQRGSILLLAYPEKYWEEVKASAEGYRYDPRVFHALVREESNFNKDIVSHAGARGLSQLMPATARGVAGWLGMKVTNDQLFIPTTNLKIGARYLESLFKRYNGNPCLSLAGYNAGEGNVGKWLERDGNRPTDEYVEAISYRETRHYVKRVLRTYQTYRLLYDDGPAFPDMAAFNHASVP
ncbi:MAG: transglycosylase SLT domain-containing protein [Alphaproteobacteria bacterium]|nr:transglycosylase SLT domain-containing protein [Alphaproteobacteria bacterium]